MVSIPAPGDYHVSSINGFLSAEPPLQKLPDSYYGPWEAIVKNLQGLLLSGRLHEQVDRMPILTTDRLSNEAQWRRAYSVLGFITHSYIWGGKKPMEWIPPTITLPLMSVCKHLELPPVATYAGLVLWNWKPIFGAEPTDTLANLDMIETFTGSLDEKWFYLISVAIEAQGAPLIPLMLHAMKAASHGDTNTVTKSLQLFAEKLDELGQLLLRMYDNCDPHIFYHRLRPYLAGSKNMADAGLPNGVIFDNGGPINKQRYVQYSGGSNAQSSLIQFFDLVLGEDHNPTASKAVSTRKDSPKKAQPPSFIHEMRQYMPGPHARFLSAVAEAANIRDFVQLRGRDNRALTIAFDASLAMLSALRDKHIQIVSRYIVVKSGEAKRQQEKSKAGNGLDQQHKQESLPLGSNRPTVLKERWTEKSARPQREKKDLIGTGGSSLIPFLRQARDETKDKAIDAWTRTLLSGRSNVLTNQGSRGQEDSPELNAGTQVQAQGLASVWKVEEAGLCQV